MYSLRLIIGPRALRRPRRPLTESAGSYPSKSQVDGTLGHGDGKMGDGKIDWVYHITIDILETAIYINIL